MYEYHSPYTLDELDETKPGPSEDMSVFDEVILQTRAIVKQVFLVEHNADGTHKWGAESLAANSVTGDKIQSDAADDSKRAIGTNHIKDAAVTNAKLATDAVRTAHIKDGEVTNVKIATGIDGTKLSNVSVDTAQIKDAAVTAVKLASSATTDANRAVTAEHIRDEAVIARHLADKTITAEKLSMTYNRLMVGGRDGTGLETIVGGSLSLEVDETQSPPVAEFKVNLGNDSIQLPYALLKELCPSSPTGGGTTIADTWHTRPKSFAGVSRTWIVKDKFDVVDIINNTDIKFLQGGIYMVHGWSSAFKVNNHQCRLYKVAPTAGSILAGSMCDADSGTNSQSQSLIQGLITMNEGDVIQLQHWTAGAYGGGVGENYQGLGKGLSSSVNLENQILAQLLLLKVG